MKQPGNVLGGAIALIGLVVVGTCGCQAVSQHQPEILLFNGRIFTGAEPSFVEAVSIRGSRVIAVGSTKELTATAGAGVRRIDLAGRFVIPGINDAHLHMDFFVPEHTPLTFEGVDPPCSLVLDRLREAVRTARKEIPIIGAIGQTAFFEEACTAQMLDRLAPAHAVILHTWTPHAAILNRSAVNMFSVQTASPPVGGSYGKDGRTTTWDGVVQEYAFFDFWAGLSQRVDDERARQILRGVLDEAVQLGITSLQAMTTDPARLVRLLQDLNTPLRVRAIFLPVAGESKVKPHPRRQVSERLSYGDLKLILDGTPIERSAAMRKPYDDAPDSRGTLNVTPERIREVVRESRESGYQLMLHAVGDRAIEAVVEAVEADGAGWRERRLRVEHGDGVFPDLLGRIQRLGAVVVQNPSHYMLPELIQKRYGTDRAKVDLPLRSLVSAGVPLALGSDGPLNPFLNLMFATTYPWKPAEALTREQALVAYTRGSAYAEFADRDKGTLEPGKLADLAVLSQDILDVPAPSLPATRAVMTMVGGTIVRDLR